MGCGQSKIHLYPRKSKSKTNGKKSGHADSDTDADEDEGKVDGVDKDAGNERVKHEDELDIEECKISETDCEISLSSIRAKNVSLLQNQEISTSQQNFFQMLDKKIEEGPDYDSTSETEIALEEARLNALVQHWETSSITVSLSSSVSRSLQSTPVHVPMSHPVSSHCFIQNNLPKDTKETPYIATNTPSKIQIPLEHTSSEYQNIVISQIMQQMATVPQQLPISLLSQKLKPMSSASHSDSSQPALSHVNVSSSPKHIIDSRGLSAPHPQMRQIQLSSITQSENQATSQSGVNTARSIRPDMNIVSNAQLNMPNQMVYFNQPVMQNVNSQMAAQHTFQQTPCYGDVMHNVQAQSSPNLEYRFPPSISVQRLAPQVQKQIRETQELMKESCPSFTTEYGMPGPQVRSQTRKPTRRPTLEAKFSQELS